VVCGVCCVVCGVVCVVCCVLCVVCGVRRAEWEETQERKHALEDAVYQEHQRELQIARQSLIKVRCVYVCVLCVVCACLPVYVLELSLGIVQRRTTILCLKTIIVLMIVCSACLVCVLVCVCVCLCTCVYVCVCVWWCVCVCVWCRQLRRRREKQIKAKLVEKRRNVLEREKEIEEGKRKMEEVSLTHIHTQTQMLTDTQCILFVAAAMCIMLCPIIIMLTVCVMSENASVG